MSASTVNQRKREHDKRLKRNSALRAASRMPPLSRSAAIEWLCSQSELREQIFSWCRIEGAIQLDLQSGRWRGAATRDRA
jgi:hypothetical protein